MSGLTAQDVLEEYSDIRIGGLATSCGMAPIDTALFSQILDDKVWTGGSVAEWGRPMTPYFRHILNFYPWVEYDVPPGVNYKEIRMTDGRTIDRSMLEEAAAFIDNAYSQEGPILIHCQAGINRSNFALAYWLVTRKGWSADEAIEKIRQGRGPAALCNPTFVDFLRNNLPWSSRTMTATLS